MICSADLLTGPCKFCGYNGPGYYQKYTHDRSCPWFRIGSYNDQEAHLTKILPTILKTYFEWRKQNMDTVKPQETLEEVMAKVKTEREFQDACVSDYYAHHGKKSAVDPSRTVAAEILMMDKYIHDAQAAWAHGATDEKALDAIRKVVAMGIRCLQFHGCPERGLDCTYVIDKE